MGDAVHEACEIVRDFEVSDPELFFRTVADAHAELAADEFKEFREKFGQKAALEGFGAAGERLLEVAEGDGGLDFIKVLVDESSQGLASRCAPSEEDTGEEGVAGMFEAAEADAAAEDARDQERWETAVAKYGPAWAAWDGSEEGWVEYRDWFYDATDADDPKSYSVAYGKLSQLDDLEIPDRVARLREYGFTIETDALESVAGLFEEDDETDDGEVWQAVVDSYGADWADWDGSEEGWVEYRDWLYEAASGESVRAYSAAYRRLSPLDALTAPERVAKLKEYGFTVDAAENAGDSDPVESIAALFDEEAAAAANEAAQQSVEVLVESGDIEPEMATRMTTAFGEVVNEIPEASALTPQEIQEMLREIAHEAKEAQPEGTPS